MSEVTVVTDALRAEARLWDEQAVELGHIASEASSLSVNYLQAGIFAMLVAEYSAVVDHVTARCDEGKARMQEIADALLRNAEAYDRGDEDVASHVADAY